MTFAHKQLRSYVDRVCRLNDEIKALNGDKSEVYKEAKGNGFDPKVLKAAVKRYVQLQDDRLGVMEFDAVLELYMEALLGAGGSDDQGGAKSPSAASASPAIGIAEAPTRARAHEAEPAHDPTTGEITDDTTSGREGEGVRSVVADVNQSSAVTVAPSFIPEPATAPPKAVAAAPVEQSPSPDNAPGAPIAGEMPDLPKFLDRREKAA